MRFKVSGKKRILFEAYCLKRLGFKFPAVYGQAFLHGIQGYVVTPTELLVEDDREIPITGFVQHPRVAEAIDYHVAMTMELMPELLDRSLSAHASCYSYWEQRTELFRRHAEKVFDYFQPDGVVCFQGYYLEASILRELAVERNTECLAWEHSFLNNHLVWDNLTGVTVGTRLPRETYQKCRGLKSPEAVMSNVNAVLADLKKNKSLEHNSPQNKCELLALEEQPIVLFLGQVYTDASVIFGRNSEKDPVDLIEAVSAVCDGLDYKLVVKLHPKENGGSNPIWMPYNQLTQRKINQSASLAQSIQSGHILCDAENDFDTYDLIRRATVVVTLNSQAGLEAAAMNCPIVVCGKAFYSDDSFAVDASSYASLDEAIQAAINGWNPERHYNACEYLDVFLNEYCVPNNVRSIFQACRSMKGDRPRR